MTTDRRRNERRKSAAPISAERRAPSGERRQTDRRQSARTPLDLWVEEEKGNELYFRRTGNLSMGGIYFEQTIPHALGTRVKLRFSLPGSSEIIEATGEIVNTPSEKNGLGMGLRFLEVSADAQRHLETFLQRA